MPIQDPGTWAVDPWEGVEKDGFIWGRGALDMLFIVACQAAVFVGLAQGGFRPKGDLVFLAVSDEEAGGLFGAKWMLDNHSEMVKTDFAVTEAGGFPIAPSRYVLTVGEKGINWKRLRKVGAQAYGFSLFDDRLKLAEIAALAPLQVGLAHGDDERVSIGTLQLTAKAYECLARNFLAGI